MISMSPSSSYDSETMPSSTLPTSSITDFASLPAELRLKIWSQANEPRVVLYGDLVQKSRSYPLPTVTQLNAESRDETRLGYEPIGHGSYFDFSRDILVCDHKISDQASDQYLEDLAPRIRRLAFWDCFPDDGRVDGPYHYSVYLSACYRQRDFGKIEFDRFWFPNLDDLWIVKVGEIDPAWMVHVNMKAPYEDRLQQLAKQFRYWVDENIIEMAPLDLNDPESQAVLNEGRCGKEDCHELNRGRSKMVSKVTFIDGIYKAPDDGQKWVRILPWHVDEEKVKENRTSFQRTHRLFFQDWAFRWRRMNPMKDIFLTNDMMLPRPKHSGVAGCLGLSLISLPIWRLASTFHDTETAAPTDLKHLSKIPLELTAFPHLREFTMMCPGLNNHDSDSGSDLQSLFGRYSNSSTFESYSDDNSPIELSTGSSLDRLLNTSWLDVDPDEDDTPQASGDWYGFRYYQGSQRVEFTKLTWSDIEEIALAGESLDIAGLPQTVVRLWIVRPDDKRRPGREPHHQWTKLRMDSGTRNPDICTTSDDGFLT
ncbi:hypothetical protein FSARC_7452 [Fusarium sarcochroum]|uniref:2EXR domain-containing protein n=1 Tax=Fusarium sarcochroum TaxID=1208366 RepID=A0A8H4TV17_9HYPO|nr:hypothetical protein FSARC_7452 [Fusarium sarcochroum]